MAKTNRPTSAKRPSGRISKRNNPKNEESDDDLQIENNDDLDVEEPQERPSSGGRKSLSSREKGRISSKAKPVVKDGKQQRIDAIEKRQRTTNIRIVVAAAILLLTLLSFMFGGDYIDGQRVETVKRMNIESDKSIQDYFKTEQIQAVAKSGQAAIKKLNRALEQEINDDGPVATKNNLIAGIAYTYSTNSHITSNYDSVQLLKKIYTNKDGNLNRKFAVQALGYIPNGEKELNSIIKSKAIEADISLIALNSLPKTKNGKIPGEVLLFALEKDDSDFLKRIFPLVSENIEEFKEQSGAVRILLKNCGHADESISKSAVDLLGRCIYKPEHYDILSNNALSENRKIRENALNSLLASPPERSGKALSFILEKSLDKETKLRILSTLGNPECKAHYEAILKSFNSSDTEVFIAGLVAIGKLKNTPDKGLKEVLDVLKKEDVNPDVRLAAIIATRGFEYRKPYYYTEFPDQIPSYVLIKFIDSPDEKIKAEAIQSLEKISGDKQIVSSDWKNWFAKEKSVLDLLISMDAQHRIVQEKFKKTQFKDAKVELKKLDSLYNLIFNDHSRQWTGFDKYLEKKGADLLLLKVAVNKASPIDD